MNRTYKMLGDFERDLGDKSRKLTRAFAEPVRELQATYPEAQFGVMDPSGDGQAIANVTLPTVEKFDRETGVRIPEEQLDREGRHNHATYRLPIPADKVEGAKRLKELVVELAERHNLRPMPQPTAPVAKVNLLQRLLGVVPKTTG